MRPLSEDEKEACQRLGQQVGTAWVLRRDDVLSIYRPPPSGAHRRRLQRMVLGLCALAPVSVAVFLIAGAPGELWVIVPGLLVLAAVGWAGWQSLAQWSTLRLDADGFALTFSKSAGRPPLEVRGRLAELSALRMQRSRQHTVVFLDSPLLASCPPIMEGSGPDFEREVEQLQRWLDKLRHNTSPRQQP